MADTVIIGAGLTGLSVGYHAQMREINYEIYEQASRVGGLCKTIKKDGFSFDYSGHLLHLKDPYIQSLVKNLLGENLDIIYRNACIYSNSVYTRYPFQANLYGLPPFIIKECLLEFVKAHYENEDMRTHIYKTFHDWILAKFGSGIAKHFMFPYNEKMWTVSTDAMTCEWLDKYVPKPTLEDVFNGAFDDSAKNFGYNTIFWYPKKGGIQALCDAFASRLSDVNLNQKILKVCPDKKVVELENGKMVKYDKLISTVPLKTLVGELDNVPQEISAACAKLKHNSVSVINVGVKGDNLTDKHWVYLPEKKYIAYRVGVYSNFSKHMAPSGTTSYYIEIAYRNDRNIDREKMLERATAEMIEMGFISKKEDILVSEICDIECAYVIYDREHNDNKAMIMDYLNKHDIMSIGRYGSWEYSSMEEAILQGKRAVADWLLT